jgi:hydroxymethylcytosylglucuronate/cytosylglucuronate synthase
LGSHNDSLLVAVCNFGWGSLGKLRLILDELEDVRVLMHGERQWVGLNQELLSGVHAVESFTGDSAPAVALVINDPVAADRITAMGSAVVYVDSLPYLWATADEVPKEVDVYCAQRSPARRLRPSNPLHDRDDIVWIDPIVPRPQRHIGGSGVVINVGGLHSHLSGQADESYLALVVIPLCRSLMQQGFRVSAVCGNLPTQTSIMLRDVLGDSATISRQTPYDFEAILRTADVLFTSPGSTTILQAAALQLPTILLPPQNLSQILNAELYATPHTPVVEWPPLVLNRKNVEQLRPDGEDRVLGYIYGQIRAAAVNPKCRSEVGKQIDIAAGMAHLTVPTLGSLVGRSGAREVARILAKRLDRGRE